MAGRSGGHLDLPRAREGGLVAGFFAVFVLPESPEELAATKIPDRTPPYAQPLAGAVAQPYAAAVARTMIELLEEIERSADGALTIARAAVDVEAAVAGGAFAAILHFEGADPIDEALEELQSLYDRGLRSLGLVWSRPNAFAEGVAFRFPSGADTGPGLTPAGRRLVVECNRLGILLDLAHLNERGFWDVAGLSEAPLVATHSNVHALSASSRNLTDAQLDEIGRSGGLVGITFHAGMLSAEGGVDARVPIARVIDHVGFGSDFDGAKVPDELGDVSGLPLVPEALRERGFRGDEIAKLAHGNWLRVLRATWRS